MMIFYSEKRMTLKRPMVLMLMLVLGFIAYAPNPSHAQNRITITEGTIEPTSIAIADFTGLDGFSSVDGRLIAEIIEGDLSGSGVFYSPESAKIIPPPADPGQRPDFAEWTPLGVEALLVGSARRNAGGMIEVVFVLWDVIRQREIASGEGEASEAGLRRIAHQIADLVFEHWTGDTGYFDTRIVYVEESGPANRRIKRLAIMDQDGHNHSYLTDGSSLVLTPRFSPQVQQIAYLDYLNHDPQVYIFDIGTGRAEALGSFEGMTFAPRFSFDGKKLIMSYVRSGSTNIFEMDLATTQIKQLTTTTFIDVSPSYAPDGSQIVFNSDRSGTKQIYVMDADGSSVPKRISSGAGAYTTPVWSPRGDLIAFTKQYQGQFYIGVMNTDGSNERLLARGFLVEAPTWAPNGRVLMYFKQNPTNAGTAGESYLYRIDITGFNEKRIITPAFASDPAWSPRLP